MPVYVVLRPGLFSRPEKMTRADEQKIYHANPSFIDYLPWVEFLDEEQC
ncbi:hypothetical protein, partial [Proteus mirabilis]